MPNPFDDADLYNYILLAGQKSPGLAAVGGASSPREWDIRKGYGISGATVVYTGDGLAKFTVTFFAWTPTHFTEWDAYKALFKKPPRGVRPKAQDISHPWLEDLDIKSVVVEDLTQWEEANETGLFKRDAKLIQYRAPIPMIGKPDGSQSKPQQPTAQDEAEKQIEALVKQVKELSA